jgi:hypothetical protein
MSEKKGFVESLCSFMGDPEGLTKEDMLAEIKEETSKLFTPGEPLIPGLNMGKGEQP